MTQESETLQSQISEILESIQSCVRQNAVTAQDQEEYIRRYDDLASKYKSAKERLDYLESEQQSRLIRTEKLRRFCEILSKTEHLTAFDSHLWSSTVESIVVHSKAKVSVIFRSGTEISVSADGTK